jgi:hypothetical protein
LSDNVQLSVDQPDGEIRISFGGNEEGAKVYAVTDGLIDVAGEDVDRVLAAIPGSARPAPAGSPSAARSAGSPSHKEK